MKKDIIVIILSLLASILIVFLLILPAIDTLDLSRLNLSFAGSQLNEAEARVQKIAALEKKYKDNPGELEKLTKVLPKEFELAALLINLENLAMANGLTMDSVDFRTVDVEKEINVNPPQIGDESLSLMSQESQGATAVLDVPPVPQTYKTMAMILGLEGGYNNMKGYLKAIEGNNRLMDVTSLGYSSKSSQGGDFYSFSLQLNVYYQ